MNILKSAITGNYELIGDIEKVDCIIGQSFGAEKNGPGYVNELLAKFIIEKTNSNLPLLLQGEIADAFNNMTGRTPELTIKGDPSTALGSKLDSWEVLRQIKDFMDEHDLSNPLIVAQAFHVGRVAMQAVKLGMDPITPKDLPREFDPNSTQIWTRSKELWIPREIIGMSYLKIKGKL